MRDIFNDCKSLFSLFNISKKINNITTIIRNIICHIESLLNLADIVKWNTHISTFSKEIFNKCNKKLKNNKKFKELIKKIIQKYCKEWGLGIGPNPQSPIF